ncbi:hypothetical protein AVEN_166563-1 [Araneus ventricosus]|uniref:Tc1-like transposase DDE domain-containing protein n=1 Tax=Araneus ventricosus TaxID=182803 RepID=A0A4Y2L2R8_ARAVE|nr:hypothetical protein AVEN_166563-1 [Araneus ventricosus]
MTWFQDDRNVRRRFSTDRFPVAIPQDRQGTCWYPQVPLFRGWESMELYGHSDARKTVWSSIILGSRTDLHVLCGSMKRQINRDVRLFRGAMGTDFAFMVDNALPHQATVMDECLEDIKSLE